MAPQYAVRFSSVLIDTSGSPVKNAPYQLLVTGTSTPAPLYSARNKTAFTGQLVTSDIGNALFWTDPGYYDVKVGANPAVPLPYIGEDDADTVSPGDVVALPAGSVTRSQLDNDVSASLAHADSVTAIPADGWTRGQLAPGVRDSLGKADTALQVAPVTSVNGQTGAVTVSTGGGGGGTTVSDASTTVKGIVQLAGDLAGTADAPTVPGLTDKTSTADLAAAIDTALTQVISAPQPDTHVNPPQVATKRDLGRYTLYNDKRLTDRRPPAIESITAEAIHPTYRRGTDWGFHQIPEVVTWRRQERIHDRYTLDAARAEMGYEPSSRAETMPRFSMATDLTVSNGTVYFWFVETLQDILVSQFFLATGRTTSAGATLIKSGMYEMTGTGSYKKRAESGNNATTAMQTAGGMDTYPFRTAGGFPRFASLAYQYRYAFAFIAVNQTTQGTVRGIDLNGTQNLKPLKAQELPGQTDLPASIPVNAWSARNYALNDEVVFNGTWYRSIQGANANHQPDTNPLWWTSFGGGTPTNSSKLAWGAIAR